MCLEWMALVIRIRQASRPFCRGKEVVEDVQTDLAALNRSNQPRFASTDPQDLESLMRILHTCARSAHRFQYPEEPGGGLLAGDCCRNTATGSGRFRWVPTGSHRSPPAAA